MNPVTFDESRHVYLDGSGTPVQSVTRIIREVLQTTTFGHSDTARYRGDAVHRCCQLISEGRWDEESTSPEIARFAKGWERLIQDTFYVSRYWEVPMVSRFGYSGRPDTWGQIIPMVLVGGEFHPVPFPAEGYQWALYDQKSGQFPMTTGLQLAAYDLLIHENFPKTPRLLRRGAQLSKDGKYTIRTGMNLPGHGFVDFNNSMWDNLWNAILVVYRSGLMKIEEIAE